jgi:DMSO/TMAO reductase YedYZ heme-binding membrane subunit
VPLGVLHYWMAVKADKLKPLVFALVVGLLLGARVWHSRKKKPAA